MNKYICPKCKKELTEADVIKSSCPFCRYIFEKPKIEGDHAETRRENVVTSGVKQERTTFISILLLLFGVGGFCFGLYWSLSPDSFLSGIICVVFGLYFVVSASRKLRGVKTYRGRCPYCDAELIAVKAPADTCACCKKPFLVRDDGFHKMD